MKTILFYPVTFVFFSFFIIIPSPTQLAPVTFFAVLLFFFTDNRILV